MSDGGRSEFSKRLAKLTKRHEAMTRGYVATLRGDGLIVLEPRKLQFQLPFRGFVILMLLFMTFKGYMMAVLGETAYAERLTVLHSGSIFEKVGALIMGLDPISRVIGAAFSVVV